MWLCGCCLGDFPLLLIFVLSAVHKDRETAESAGLDLAKVIASKSPVAIQGSKVNLVYSRDHPVPDSLEYAVSDDDDESY